MDRRKKDAIWLLDVNGDGTVPPCDAQLAVLMDIRDELNRLNQLLRCSGFIGIPQTLKSIRRKIPTVKKTKKGRK